MAFTATAVPGCRNVCKGKPGEVMDELVGAFKRLKAEGMSEAQARALAKDVGLVAALFPRNSLGALWSVAEAFVASGCADCAVDQAYEARRDRE